MIFMQSGFSFNKTQEKVFFQKFLENRDINTSLHYIDYVLSSQYIMKHHIYLCIH